jgi:hypothetical protein
MFEKGTVSIPARSSSAVTELRRQPFPGRWRSKACQSSPLISPRSTWEKMFVSNIGVGFKWRVVSSDWMLVGGKRTALAGDPGLRSCSEV